MGKVSVPQQGKRRLAYRNFVALFVFFSVIAGFFSIGQASPNYVAAVDDSCHVYTVDSNVDGTFSNYRYMWYLGNMGTGCRSTALGDYNNDGHLDFIVGYYSGNVLYYLLFLNDGSGNFLKGDMVGSLSAAGGWAMDSTSGDFNNDGNLDFIASGDSGKIAIFLGDGAGHFTKKSEMTIETQGRGLDVADFNEDGNLDFVRATYSSGDVYLYLGDGTGNFTLKGKIVDQTSGDPYGVSAGDFDNDGHMDIIMNTGGGGDTFFRKGQGDGTFSPGVTMASLDLNNHGSFDAYDFNGDGNLDIVIANYSGRGIWYYPGTGTDTSGNPTFGVAVQLNKNSSGTVTNTSDNVLSLSAPPLPPLAGTPVAKIGADATTIPIDGTVNFNSTGTSDDGTIVNYSWDFGDGSTLVEGADQAAPSHAYGQEGLYYARLTVTDNSNRKSSAQLKIAVLGNAPVAVAGGPYDFTEADALFGKWWVQLDGSGSTDEGGIAGYQWDFGGGFLEDFEDNNDTGWGKQEGSWAVTGAEGAYVYTQSNATIGRSRNIFPSLVPVDYAVEVDTIITSGGGEEVQLLFDAVDIYNNYELILRGRGLNDLLLYRRQSDGTTQLGHVQLAYAIVKNKLYHLKVQVQGNKVKAYLDGNLIFDSTISRYPNAKVGLSTYQSATNFDNLRVTSLPHVGASLVNINHLFSGPGTYSATLTVFDKAGQSSSDTATVTITKGVPPVASAGGPYSLGEVDAYAGSWRLLADPGLSTDDGRIYQYLWDFGDGTTMTDWNSDNKEAVFAAGYEFYGMDVLNARLSFTATQDSTSFRIINLATRQEIGSNTLNKYGTWSHDGPVVGTTVDKIPFKIESNKPLLVLQTNGSGHTAFMPALDGNGVGHEFIFYYYTTYGTYYLYAIEDTYVEFYGSNGNPQLTYKLAAGSYTDLGSLPNNAIYSARSWGKIAIQSVAPNSFTAVPSADGDGAGRIFYAATHNWGGGSLATFAHQDAQFKVYDLDSGSLLYDVAKLAGEQWFQNGVGLRRLRVESSGDIELWAGDNQGAGLDNMGDDLTFIGGKGFKEYYFRALNDGAVLFVPYDGTTVTINGTSSTFNGDQYQVLTPSTDYHVVSDKPVFIQILGKDGGWDDFGTYLAGVVQPIHRYKPAAQDAFPKQYNVSVKGVDHALQTGELANSTVTLTPGTIPVAEAGPDQAAGEAEAVNQKWTFNFSGGASTDDVSIWRYQWDFGDGSAIAEGKDIAHIYSAVGVYTVKLTVTDNAMQTATDTLTVSIIAGPPPASNAGIDQAAGEAQAVIGQWTMNFTGGASTDEVGIWRYQWDFGDGKTGEGKDISHVYSKIGVYTVTLTVTDNAMQTNIDTLTVTISAGDPPVADPGGPYSQNEADAVNGGWTVDLNGNGSADEVGIIQYTWDLGTDTFDGYAFNKSKWLVAGLVSQYDAIFLTGNGAWGVTNLFSKDNYSRAAGMSMQAKVKQTGGPAMIGFKNTTATNSYTAMPHAIYFNNGNFQIYEDGANRGNFGTYSFNTWYDVKVELKEPSGARYYYRPSGNTNWTLLYDSTYGSNADLKRGTDVYSGTFIMDDLKEIAVGPTPTVRLYGPAEIILTVEDNAHQLNAKGTTFEVITDNQPPVAHAGGPYFSRDGLPLVLDGGKSTDDNGITGYRWELEDGTVLFGKKVMQKFNYSGVVYPVSATASSQYGSGSSYSPMQATGAPNVATCSDNGNAWTSSSANMGAQWLEVTYANKVLAERVVVRESYSPGFVTQIDFYDANDQAVTVWSGTDTNNACPGWFKADINPPMETQKVRVYVNTNVAGWNEIDAVGLIASGSGQQLVKLTVTDTFGFFHTDTTTVTVSPDPTVVAAPWQFHGGVEIPHDTWSGKEILLKAVAYDSFPNDLTYTWDFGDGSATVSGKVTNPYALETTHTYTGTAGTLYTAKITVTDMEGKTHSDTYPVTIRAQNMDAEINIAIDDGLWWLHKNQYRNAGDYYHGRWSSYSSAYASPTASAIQAFEINGHLEIGDIMDDPYVETVWNGMDFLFRGGVNAINIASHIFGNPDSNGNGIGIQAADGWPPYQTGMVMDAIVASQTPSEEVRVGGVQFIGRSYRDVVQDMVDMYAWGISDDKPSISQLGRTDYIGGWRYNWGEWPDNSASQWAAIGMIPAEKIWKSTIPQWVKTYNDNWLWYSFTGNRFGYTNTGDGNYSSIATRPSGMVQMVMNGKHNLDPMDTRWVAAEGFFANAANWDWFINHETYYAWYAFAKAMRLGGKGETLTNGFNWFRGNDAATTTWGIARKLMERQEKTGANRGRWIDGGQVTHPGSYGNVLDGAWSIIMLTPTLFELPPVANAGGNKVWGSGLAITFDGSASRHLDPRKQIVLYEWDFDGDGVYDLASVSPIAKHTYEVPTDQLPKTFNVTLRVTDNGQSLTPPEEPLQDTDTIQVLIVEPPHPPVAVAGGPYRATVGVPVTLDGSQSFDIDDIAGDYVTLFQWDLDGDWDFNATNGGMDKEGDRLTASVISWTFTSAGVYNVGLRVWDNGVLNNDIKLSQTAFTTVTVTANEAPVAVLPQNYVIQEGSLLVLDGRSSYDPNGTAIGSYLWDLNNDGVFGDATGPTVTYKWSDNGSYVVKLKVVDLGDPNLSGVAGTTVQVTNVAPQVNAGKDQVVFGNLTVQVQGQFNDPAGDLDKPYTFLWNFGDGGIADTLQASHSYQSSGTYKVTLDVTDKDGGKGSSYLTVLLVSNPVPVVVGASNGQVVLDWSSYQQPQGLAHYLIYQSEQPFSSVTGMTPVQNLNAGQFQTVVSNLVNGTTYYFALVSSDGPGAFSPAVSSIPGTPKLIDETPPLPVTALQARILSGDRILLSWAPSVSPDAASYSIYGDNGTGTMDYATALAILVHPENSWTSPALTRGLTYRFGVRTTDISNNVELNINTVTVLLDYPDLKIAIAQAPASVNYGDTASFTIDVTNQGNVEAKVPFNLGLYLNDQLKQTWPVTENIAAGQTRTLTINWQVTANSSTTPYNVKFAVDKEDLVVESDETNNESTLKTMLIKQVYFLNATAQPDFAVRGETIQLSATATSSDDLGLFLGDTVVNVKATLWAKGVQVGAALVFTYDAEVNNFGYALNTNTLWGTFEVLFKLYDTSQNVLTTAQRQILVGASDYYVNVAAGSDSLGDGSQSSPWKTITHAMSQILSPTAILHVLPGTYSTDSEEVFPIQMKAGVSLIGDNQAPAVIVGQADREVMVFSGNTPIDSTTAIKNLTIEGGSIGVHLTSDVSLAPTLEYNTIKGNQVGVLCAGTGECSPTIQNNTIQDNTRIGIEIRGTFDGISGISSPVIFGNHLEGNDQGINLNLGGNENTKTFQVDIRNNVIASHLKEGLIAVNSGGAWQSNTNMVLFVKNNLLALNGSAALLLDATGGPISGFIQNNTIVDNGIGLDSVGANPAINNTIFWNNQVELQGVTSEQISYSDIKGDLFMGENGNISVDPQFLDAAVADYRLAASSALVDAGVNLNVEAIDLDGLPRTKDGDSNGEAVTDIGAYEVQFYVYAGQDLTVNPDEIIYFNGVISGAPFGYAFTWDFGDGNLSIYQNPSYSYPEDGIYAVRLTVKNETGTEVGDLATVTVRQPSNLTVVKTGSGHGTVTSIPAGIDCGNDCTELDKAGRQVTLTAVSDSKSNFGGWSGDYSDSNPIITVTLDANKTVEALFCLRGDMSGDGAVGLEDAIITLQVAAGMYPGLDQRLCSDIHGLGKLTLPDAIYILQVISGVR